MSQPSDAADAIRERLNSAPFPLASLVRELRDLWGPGHGVRSVHGFIREVATCLLHDEDVEVGYIRSARFVPWQLDPWDADQKIDRELMAMTTFLDDEAQYIFRRKSPNH